MPYLYFCKCKQVSTKDMLDRDWCVSMWSVCMIHSLTGKKISFLRSEVTKVKSLILLCHWSSWLLNRFICNSAKASVTWISFQSMGSDFYLEIIIVMSLSIIRSLFLNVSKTEQCSLKKGHAFRVTVHDILKGYFGFVEVGLCDKPISRENLSWSRCGHSSLGLKNHREIIMGC